MCRIISVIFVIWLSLCMTVNSYAQTFPIEPYPSGSILLEKDNILPIDPFKLGSKSIKFQEMGINPEDVILVIKKRQDAVLAREVFKELYNKPKVDEKEMIREEWRKFFGIDVWEPYYKAKAVEKWVKNKFSVKVFKLKGEPQIEKKQFTYTFKTKF